MSQPNEKAEQSKKTTAATKQTTKQPGKKASKAGRIWIVGIILILGGMAIASYLARGTGDTPRPVVSADEEPIEESSESVSGATTGALVITSDIRGADVYLNGKRVGKTPHKATPLTVGRYQVKVMKAGYETFEKNVEVSSPDDTLRADLKPAASAFRVESNVSGASVELDGQPRGSTPVGHCRAGTGDVRARRASGRLQVALGNGGIRRWCSRHPRRFGEIVIAGRSQRGGGGEAQASNTWWL